jgi:hypothetical protein
VHANGDEYVGKVNGQFCADDRCLYRRQKYPGRSTLSRQKIGIPKITNSGDHHAHKEEGRVYQPKSLTEFEIQTLQVKKAATNHRPQAVNLKRSLK